MQLLPTCSCATLSLQAFTTDGKKEGGVQVLTATPLQQRCEVFITNFRLYFIWAAAALGGASFRSADAAQVCSDVGSVEENGVFECSFATAARQIVSERW